MSKMKKNKRISAKAESHPSSPRGAAEPVSRPSPGPGVAGPRRDGTGL